MDRPAARLMRRIRKRDPDALDKLITRHGAVLRTHLERYVGAADAEDLLQELWLRVWLRADQWEGRGRLLTWLLSIATNLALNHLRARRPVVSLSETGSEQPWEDVAPPLEALVPGPEEQVLWRDELKRVRAAMALLPPDKQQALRVVRWEGRSLREAASVLGVPVGTVKSRLHHAQRLLTEYLEEET